jgi:hypothetical protein
MSPSQSKFSVLQVPDVRSKQTSVSDTVKSRLIESNRDSYRGDGQLKTTQRNQGFCVH